MTLSSVDLPQPVGPTMATNSPSATSSEARSHRRIAAAVGQPEGDVDVGERNRGALPRLLRASALSPRRRRCSCFPLAGLASLPAARKLAGHHSLDQPGVDQQAVEPPGLGAAGALEKQPVAALQDFLLLDKRRDRAAGPAAS